MNDMDKKLTELFEQASTQTPVASFEETSARFASSISAGNTPTGGQIAPSIISGNGPLWLIVFSIAALTAILINNSEPTPSDIHTSFISDQNPEENSGSGIVPQNKNETIVERDPAAVSETENKTKAKKSAEQVNPEPPKELKTSKIQPLKSDASTKYFNNLTSQDDLTQTFGGNNFMDSDSVNFAAVASTEQLAQKDTAVVFTVTELSTESDFRIIAKRAKEAGITFKYQVHSTRKEKGKKRGKIKTDDLFLIQDFKINMSIEETNRSSQVSVDVPKWGKFTVSFGWFENESGKAVRLTESVKVTQASSFHEK